MKGRHEWAPSLKHTAKIRLKIRFYISLGADDIYIAYNLFIIFPILRSTLNKPGTTDSCNMYFQYTLLADILHGSSELVLQELTFLGNLFSLLQEVLCSSLHWRRQNVCLLWATLLLIGWAFVAGVYQCGDLWQRLKKCIFTRDWLQGLKRLLEIKVMQLSGCYVTLIQEIGVWEIWAVLFMALYFAFSIILAQKCSRVCGLWLNRKLFPGLTLCKIHLTISPWCVNTLKMWKVNFLLSCLNFQKIYTKTCRPGNQPFETISMVMQHLPSKWQHSQKETEWRRKPKLPGWPGAPAASPRPKCGSPNFLGPIWSWCWVY